MSPNQEIVRWERVKVGKSRTLARKKRIRARTWNRKKVSSTLKDRGFQEGKGEQAERIHLGKKLKA